VEDPLDRQILVKPTYLLKGSSLPNTSYIRGFLSDETIQLPDRKIRVHATKSSELDLWRPHPEVWTGGCSRQTFERGMQIVLFFKRHGEKLNWLDPAFSRSSEDVSGPDSLWVRAVKLYARISQLPLAEQEPALKAEMLKLRKDGFLNSENELLADDIERQLAGVGPVSHFVIDKSSVDKKRWIENIVNVSYHRQIKPNDVASQNAPIRSKTFWWVIGGMLIIVASILIVAILRKRARRPA
jgi:hypothetical protein